MVDVSQLIPQLLPIVQQVIGGALSTGGSGFIGKVKEAGALTEFMKESADTFKGNSIIEGLLGQLADGTFLEGLDLNNFDLGGAMEQVGGLNGLLAEFGDEGSQVKTFIFGLAEKVVNASGSGFLGTGTKVTEGEQNFLDTLKQQLGL